MERVNIYGFPHKGLRNGLGKLSLVVSKLDTEDEQEVATVLSMAEELSVLLKLHLTSEEEFVTPPVEAKVPGSMKGNHEDHEKMEALEKDMLSEIRNLKENPNPKSQQSAYTAINLFIREYYRHMSEEENEINAIVWNNFNDEEILSWQGQILSKLTPDQFFMWFKYIIPALSPMEQRIMLGGFKENAPEEAYRGTLKALEPFLSQKQISFIQTI